MKRVAIIGHFGGKENFCDGQTIKTKNLEKLLASQADISVKIVDTYYSNGKKIKLLIHTILSFFTCEYVFLLVSVNGLKVYLPLLYYLNKISKKQIYHYVIGSELLELASQNKKLVKYLNAFEANWFEYESGTQRLKQMGVKNAITVPNFKDITPVLKATLYPLDNRIYAFCTFSRVMREKGITDAIKAISKVKTENSSITIYLDIYGPIEPTYKDEFEQLLQLHSDCVAYKGIVDSDKSVDVLKNYYALLFPTKWPGEGLPGTIIDAFASGVPVIASDWNANKELVQDMKHGIIYPTDEINTLYDAVDWSVKNVDLINSMRIECREQFIKYMPETVLGIILQSMQR